MADVFSAAKRSEIMSRVKSRGNLATEVRLLKFFREQRISGWRRSFPVFGKPDFVFPKKRLAVFVDGCFWHGCPIHGSLPATNVDFWMDKIERNKARDRLVNRELRRQGWHIVRFWQHELKDPKKLSSQFRRYLVFNQTP